MKRIFLIASLLLLIPPVQGPLSAQSETWDIVGRYQYSDESFNYEAAITVSEDYRISLESSIVGGICGFDGQVAAKEKIKVAKILAANPQSVEVTAWNGEEGDYSDDFIFQFTPTTAILKRGPTKNFSYYCGARLSLPDDSEIFKK